MSGFDANWLALREPADHRSRSAALVDDLRAWLSQRSSTAPCLVDLGCGTGSNLRYLAPRLGGPQHWIGVDDDEALLRVLAAATPRGVTVDTRRADLARGLRSLDPVSPHVVVASALLDLVSDAWLASLVEFAAGHGAALLLALSYDGRMQATPAHPADDEVRAAFNAHQRRDKGFGPALGPDACEAIAATLAARGYEVRRANSDWRLDAASTADAALMAPLLDGIAAAASEQRSESGRAIAAWLAERQGQCARGALRLTVGHEDALGLPPLQ